MQAQRTAIYSVFLHDIILVLGQALLNFFLKVRQVLGTSKVFKLSSRQVFMSMLKSVKLSGCQVVKFDPWDMLNSFCFMSGSQLTNAGAGKGNYRAAGQPQKHEIRFQVAQI